MNIFTLTRLLLLQLSIVLSLSAQQPDWITQIDYSIPDGSFISDVDCLDSLNCAFVKTWGIGFTNTIFRSTDGGVQWSSIHQQDSTGKRLPRYMSVAYTTKNTIIACGDSGILVRTTDGGTSWKTTRIAVTHQLNKIIMANPKHGIIQAIGPNPEYILATSDSGATWDSIAVPIPPMWEQRYIESATTPAPNVFICAIYYEDSTAIAYSADRGKTWKYFYDPPCKYAQFFFLDSLNGWMSSGKYFPPASTPQLSDIFSRTYDGGITWHPLLDTFLATGFGISDLSFADSLHGLAVGGDKVLRTTDGGLTWNRETLDFDSFFTLRVSYKPGSNGVITGATARVLRYVGKSIDAGPQPEAPTAFDLAPNRILEGAVPVLRYQLPQPSRVGISMISVTGQERVLQPATERDAGLHQFQLPTEGLPSGLYFIRITNNQQTRVLPLQVLR